MPTSASRLLPTSRSTSVIRAAPGSADQTRTPTACCVSTSQEEPTSRASLRVTWMRLRCDSINVRERPWASKRQPIDYKRCCTDQLNSHSESDHRADIAGRLKSAISRLVHRSKKHIGAAAQREGYSMVERLGGLEVDVSLTLVACYTGKISENLGNWRTSTLGQPRPAHPIDIMIEVLGVLVDASTFRAFNREIGIDPQHLR